jgi:transposase
MSSAPAHTESSPAPRKRRHVEHSDEMRERVVFLRARGDSWAQIESATGVVRTTAQGIWASRDAEGHASKKQRDSSHHAVFPAAVREQVVSAQERDAALRLRDLQQLLQLPPDTPRPSLATCWRALQEAGFSTKHMQPYATDRSSAATKKKRQTWVRDVGRALTAESAVFIDETPFSFCIMRSRGRSRKGVPALGVIPAIRGRNHSVIAAISPTLGLLHFAIHATQPSDEFVSKRKGSKTKKTGPKGVTRDVFRSFLLELLALPHFSDASQQRTLVYDNARIHGGDIPDVIFSAGHTPQPLPPWSPELNPIEYAFSTWKLAYRVLCPATDDAIDPAIRQSAAAITPAKCQHDFDHTRSLYDACEALEDL